MNVYKIHDNLFSNREVVCVLSKFTAGIYHFITCPKFQLVISTDKGKYNYIIIST